MLIVWMRPRPLDVATTDYYFLVDDEAARPFWFCLALVLFVRGAAFETTSLKNFLLLSAVSLIIIRLLDDCC